MWILRRVNNDDKFYLLCDKPKYTVGRNKTCDIVGELTQSSVGRFHATLQPYEDRVEIIDTESKYGTYINDQITTNAKISPNTPHSLKDGDTVRFGFIDFTWKLEKVSIVVLTSTLAVNDKDKLKKVISILGGQTLDQWSDTCTHLVVTNLTFTVKVLQSLCHAIPIVKPEYFCALLSSIRRKESHPAVETFEPPILERLVGNSVSLQVNIDRKRLFAGKTFVFMNSRHMDRFQGLIQCGMGRCSSVDKKRWQKKSLVEPGIIVINNTTSSSQSQVATQAVNDLNDFIRSKGSRMIPDSEISLAILHCSLDKFCNPKHTLKDNFESALRVVPSTLIANNTPVVNRNEADTPKSTNSITVPETMEQPIQLNSVASTSNSNVINLIDDDDDAMLVQCLDETMKTSGRGKRKNSSSNEDVMLKKPHLDDKSIESPTKSSEADFMFQIPQKNTRSVSKIKNVSVAKSVVEEESMTTLEEKKKRKKQDPKPSTSRSYNNKEIPPPQSNQDKPTTSSSCRISLIECPQGQKQVNSTQAAITTSTQMQSSQRKRTAHRSFTSTLNENNSDSDDELFKFNDEASAKKSKPSKESDSDSDDNMNYPQSSRPVSPIVRPQAFSQQSQIASDSWLSRPTPSQHFTGTTVKSKPKNRNDHVRKPISVNVSAGWQIGQHSISNQPVRIPTQGWYSKDTIQSKSFDSEIKQEISIEDSKWIDSIKQGIQVITKSMNLISTSGKVFKKQQFMAPTEVIKTTKIYKF